MQPIVMVLPPGETKDGKCEAMHEEDEEEKDTHDHISDLPDSVIAYILSLLDSRKAIATSTLSTRWTHLWKSINNLYFFQERSMDEVKNYRNFIDRVLHLRHGMSRIDTFTLHLDYNNEDAHLVDSWIHYAVTHNTRVLWMRLELNGTKPYEYPPLFYNNNASVEELFLDFGKLDIPPSSSRFSALLNVRLVCVSLGNGAIKNLTSTAPCLRHLEICNCTWEGSIHIDNHPNLERVSIVKTIGGPSGDITIHGLNLKRLTLVGTILMRRCRIKDMSSGVALSLCFEKMFEAWDGVYNNADADRLIELLDRLRCIPIRLRLCSWCIQVLAIRGVMAGGPQGSNILPLNLVELELETTVEEWKHPEIAYLLRRCRNLQNLTIDIGRKRKKYELNSDFLNNYDLATWRAKEMSSPCVIEHIKTVKIISFMTSSYIRANVKENNDMDVIHKISIENEIKFIVFLLENLAALEKMTISTIETYFNEMLPKSESLQEFLVLLKDFPKAEIIF